MRKSLSYYAGKMLSGSFFITLSDSLIKIASLLLLPVFTYYLSPKDYGIISIVMLISGFLSLIYNPGIISSTRRIYYDHEDHSARQEIIGSGFGFFILVPLAFLVLSLLAGSGLFARIFKQFPFYPYGLLAVLLSLFSQPKRMWSMLLAIQYKISRLAVFTVLSFLLGIGLSLVLVLVFKMGALGRIYGMLGAAVFMFIISFQYIYRFTAGKFSKKILARIVKFGAPLTFAIWAYTILNLADRYMLERMMNLEAVGLYSVGYKIASIPLFVSLGFRKIWTPVFFENMNLENYFVIRRLVTYFTVGITLITSLIILFSSELFSIFINPRFMPALSVIPYVALGIFFLAALTIATSILDYQKKYPTLSLFGAIAAGSNIVLNLLLIPKLGMVGAAIATFIAYLLYFLFCSVNIWKVFRKVVDIPKSLIIVSLMVLSFIFIQFLSPGSRDLLIIKISLVAGWSLLLLLSGVFQKEFNALKKRLIK